MDPKERWEKIWDLFDRALAQPEPQRTAWLAEACGPDTDLRKEVDSLLGAHHNAAGILDQPVGAYASEALSTSDDPANRDELIGPYRILQEIGRGGMGVVYKAEDTRLRRFVALKFLPPNLTARNYAKQRLLSEARAASKLDHPNICTIHDIGETPDGRTFMAMAYYEGRTLAARIADGPLPVGEALGILTEVAHGLEHAHAAGVIHRDIKPSNILLTAKGKVKVLDCGLAKQGLDSLTDPAMRLGTAFYMSPEQALGKDVDHRTDLWSLGATLYEMVAGGIPFGGDNEPSVLYKVVHEEPEPVRAEAEGRLGEILGKLLAKNPDARYQRASELLEDCQPRPEAIPVDAAAHPGSRSLWRLAALAALVLVATVAVVWFVLPASDGPELLEPVPMTSFPGREETAAFSPDDTQIAFSWNGEGQDNFDIYLKPVDSANSLRLTRDPAWDSSPSWSPDGKRIAFLRERTEGTSEVREIPRIGGSERLLAEISASPRLGVSWSPDGRYLAVPDRPSRDGPPGVSLVAVDSGEKSTLVLAPTGATEVRTPVFSPDGDTVAFDVVHGAGLGDTYLVSATGGEPERLTHSGGEPEGLAWT
ncbi:MAG: protein kinase, partial [bacterium]|nr:protein kinase [bacterium]